MSPQAPVLGHLVPSCQCCVGGYVTFRTWGLQDRWRSGGVGLESHGPGLLAAWVLCFPIMTQVSSPQSRQLQVVLDNGTLNSKPEQILSFFFKLLCQVFGFSIEKNKAGVLPLEHQARQKTLNPPHTGTELTLCVF